MKAMFHWARNNDILENIPNIDAVSRGKIVHQEMYTFISKQVNKLLSAAQNRNLHNDTTIRFWHEKQHSA